MYIGDLCVSKGAAIQTVQAMVCEVVLKESNADVLMNLRYIYTTTTFKMCTCSY